HNEVNIIGSNIEKSRQSGVYIGLTDRSDVNSIKVKIKMASLCLGLLLCQHLITAMKMPK
ncbi:MAG: hypothetical protein ACFN4I_07725, partial [Campylobacter concisus]